MEARPEAQRQRRQPQRRGRKSSPGRDWSEATMTPVHKACMEFAISLLDQKVIRSEYDCALTCALAALAVNRNRNGGWRAPDTYSPILSAVIKIARFMVVQKATEIVMERYNHR